jgi:UDP-N-acetylglucosamine 1-carboxyvinyltransferase
MDVFLLKLEQMGHVITRDPSGRGITLDATDSPRSVSFKTMPYPGFPTDLQAPMLTALTCASGTGYVHETVFENRLLHVKELQKMGAQIITEGNSLAIIKGVDRLYGAHVIGSDLRATSALILAGLTAEGTTVVSGMHHLYRGYQNFIDKLTYLGASITPVHPVQGQDTSTQAQI